MGSSSLAAQQGLEGLSLSPSSTVGNSAWGTGRNRVFRPESSSRRVGEAGNCVECVGSFGGFGFCLLSLLPTWAYLAFNIREKTQSFGTSHSCGVKCSPVIHLGSFREMLEKQVFAIWCQKMSQHREHRLAERMVSGSPGAPQGGAGTLRACFRSPPGALPLRTLLDTDPCCRATRLQPGFTRPGQGLASVSLSVSGLCRWFLGPPSSCMSSSSALVIVRGLDFSWLLYHRLCDPSNLSCCRPCSTQSCTFCRSRGLCGASRQRHTAWSSSSMHWPVPTTTSGGSGRPSVSGGRAPEGSEQSEWPLVPWKPFPARGSFDYSGRLLALSVCWWGWGGGRVSLDSGLKSRKFNLKQSKQNRGCSGRLQGRSWIFGLRTLAGQQGL